MKGGMRMNAGVVGFGSRMKHFLTVFLSRMSGWAAAKDWWRAFFAMLLLSRARVGPGLAPFAAAYFSVSMESGPNLAALLAGCLTGAIITGVGPQSLFTPAACAVILTLWLLWDRLRHTKKGAHMDGSLFFPMAAGLGVMLPGLAAAGYDPQMWLMCLVWAMAASVMAMEKHLRLSMGLTSPGLALWSAAIITLAGSLGINPGPVAAMLSAFASGAGRGSAAGIILGAVCLMSGGHSSSLILAAFSGAAGDAAHALRPTQFWRTISSCLACAIVALWQGAPYISIILCALPAAVPKDIREVILGVISPARTDGEQLAAAYRMRTQTQLHSLSDAFSELSAACGADDPAFGEQQLITSMRSALCSGCQEYPRCWPGHDSRGVKLFCQFMTAAIERGSSPFDGGEVSPEIMRLCRRGMLAPSRLGGMLADFAAQRHRRVRLMEARRLMSAEFSQAAELLNAMAQEQTSPVSVRSGAAARAKRQLSAEGLPVTNVTALFRDRLEIMVEAAEPWSVPRLKKAQSALKRALGRPFSPSATNLCRASFISGANFSAPAAASALPADPDLPSGDSHMVRDLGDGKVLIAISDGMGTGEAAAGESRRVLRLILSLLKAGIPRELSLSAINCVMLSRGGEEMFATVDMLIIDLSTGRAEFTKLSACRSYILRSGKIIRVEGGRLPLGILEKVEPARENLRLKNGDIIVMMTDGVADALPENILEDLMKSASEFSPAAMSEALVNAAAARAPRRRDDMTALCVKLCS